MPGWRQDDHRLALSAFLRSCDRFDKLSPRRRVGPTAIATTVKDWLEICSQARRDRGGGNRDARRFFERHFTPVAVLVDGESEGMFTGYFEPELRGSRTADSRYRVPLYRPPPDHLRRYDRARIDAGALGGRDLELVWVDDPVDAFFLQVQGSGRVVTPEGELVRVGYAGQNGQPYYPIGRALIDWGEIDRDAISMQSIRQWLRQNPHKAQALMALNRSYVFFRIVEGEGPIGAFGVPLTAERSLAVDPDFVPLGGPVWIDVADPLQSDARLRRLVIAQDTGGAIKGAIRGDLFWGHGNGAALRAGMMKSQGRYFLLVPRGRGLAMS